MTTGPPNLNEPAAKAILGLLRLYISTGNYPVRTPPADLKRAATTYTGTFYKPGKHGCRAAIRDLEAWLANEKDKAS